MYKYKAFGLVIDSEIEFSEMLPTKGLSVVTIKKGKLPIEKRELKKELEIGRSKVHLYTDNTCLINFHEVGFFYVSTDYEVTFQLFPNAILEEIRAVILTVVLPAILYLRKTIALHGSVIAFKDHCILFTGKSGAGKSTMAGRFIKKGYCIISDDICVIKSKSQLPYAVPALPQLKLNNDSSDFLEHIATELHQISPRAEKNWLRIEGQFEEKELPLKAIYEITTTDDHIQEEIIKLHGKDKLETIFENTYKPGVIEFMDLKKQFFQQSLWLASTVNVYQFKRRVVGFTDEKYIDEIINQNN